MHPHLTRSRLSHILVIAISCLRFVARAKKALATTNSKILIFLVTALLNCRAGLRDFVDLLLVIPATVTLPSPARLESTNLPRSALCLRRTQTSSLPRAHGKPAIEHIEHEHSSVICSFPPAGGRGFCVCLFSTEEETPAFGTRASVLKSALRVHGASPATTQLATCCT